MDNLSFAILKKRLINILHPRRGFVKIHSSITFSRKLCPKRLLIVDFKTEKYRIEKTINGWKVNLNKSNTIEKECNSFENNEEVCDYFEEVLIGVYRECIENKLLLETKIMKTINIFFFTILIVWLCGCTQLVEKTVGLDDCPLVATKSVINGDTVITCNFSLIKDTIDFPLSNIMSGLEIVKLENSDSALVSRYHTFASVNYVGVYTMESQYKLFDRKGNLLCYIGRKGQGPGEYMFLYDSQIDEKNNRIYLMPWMQKKILVYNLQGRFLSDIPLPEFVPKARFNINTDEQIVTIMILPFKGQNNYVVWQQDFQGNVLQTISSENFAFEPDYGNEIISYRNTQNTDFYLAGWPISRTRCTTIWAMKTA